MNAPTTPSDRARLQASALVEERFPRALGAVLGGSAAQGRATESSDLDVAVLLPEGEPSRREVVRHDGRPAELFLHTLEDVPEHFERDRLLRRGTILFLYDQGLTLADPHGLVASVRAQARAALAAGPPPLAPAEWDHGRYVLTCYMDDLADAPPTERHEQLALADFTLREAAQLLIAHHGGWTGVGKWLPRRLLGADPVLGKALLEGHRAVAERADPAGLALAAEQALGVLGGPLREGYVAPWRT
ncbi:nucleotidyltransferase domain-containing protein [Streptomyces luteocolor]|uniref:nucleotidyltransferase domain-containing protein n=1 Tax=Streptomyces luteocolor TaxID=285500 RepID=UPI0008539BCD|nr:nucleotidyltransferase domain-containing protein [Streptomyces luteocolor]